jgi:hypothetical protein
VQDSVFANINLAGGKGGASKAVSQSKVENCKDLYFGKGASLQLLQMRRELIPASGEMSSKARIRTRRTTQVSSQTMYSRFSLPEKITSTFRRDPISS